VRIAMVTSRHPYGGADQVAWQLARELARRHELHFITTGETDVSRDEAGYHRITIGLPRRQWFWHHYRNPTVVRKLREHLRRIRPDVVHFHSVANRTFSAAALLLSKDYPAIWSLHDVWSQCIWHKPHPADCEGMLDGCRSCREMPVFSRVNRRLKEHIWRRIDVHLVLCSEWMRRYLARSALGEKPTTVIANGVDLRCFVDLDGGPVRRRIGIPDEACVVLFVGNMTLPVKGHRELLRIARGVVADRSNVWFVFVGEYTGPASGDRRIVFTGGVSSEAMPDIFAAADVFAFPSQAEYAPLVIIEAMAAGVPQVTYAVGGIPEQVEDGRTGLLVDLGDRARFEAALTGLLNDPDGRRAMGTAARTRVERLFSLERQVSRTEELYGRLLVERSMRSPEPKREDT